MRIILKPNAFFNQLQWSQHHWWILFAFLFIAAVETHVGAQHAFLGTYARFLSQTFSIPFDVALWATVSAKLGIMLAVAYAVIHVVWVVGNFFGTKNSKRVLSRRLAIVFTVILGAYTASHLTHQYAWMATVSQFLYLWGGLLGFIAVREQFFLSITETIVVGTLGALIVMGSWIYSNQQMERYAREHMLNASSVAKSTAKTMRVRPRF